MTSIAWWGGVFSLAPCPAVQLGGGGVASESRAYWLCYFVIPLSCGVLFFLPPFSLKTHVI